MFLSFASYLNFEEMYLHGNLYISSAKCFLIKLQVSELGYQSTYVFGCIETQQISFYFNLLESSFNEILITKRDAFTRGSSKY